METIQYALTSREGIAWMQKRPLLLESELRLGDKLLATLSGSRLGHSGVVETAEMRWHYEAEGPKVKVYREGMVAELGSYRSVGMLGGKGVLELVSGRRFYWVSGILPWQALKGEWREESNAPLLRFKRVAAGLNNAGLITLEPGAESHPDVTLLMLFGWFLMAFRR